MSSQGRAGAWLVAAKVLTQLGDLLCSAKTTLPWLVLSAGGSPAVVALIVPVRESGSMLPQLALAPWVQRIEPRTQAATGAALGQAALCITIAGAAIMLHPAWAGPAVLLGVGLLALVRALASLANKDVLARGVPKGARGKINGRSTSLAGLLGVGGATAALALPERPEMVWVVALVVAAAAVPFAASGLALLRVPQDAEAKPAEAAAKTRLRETLRDPRLRRFLLARGLLLGSALGSPFLVSLGRDAAPGLRTLSAFVLAGGAASFLTASLWGRLADRSGRLCMGLGGALAGLFGLVGVLTDGLPPWAWPVLYFAFSVGYVGVRVGRKTYVVDVATGATRTQIVAASNTMIAGLLLLAGAGLAVVTRSDATIGLAVATVATLLGALSCAGLPGRA
ncbi:MAG: MFS transporter [Myxococcota bacterium]